MFEELGLLELQEQSVLHLLPDLPPALLLPAPLDGVQGHVARPALGGRLIPGESRGPYIGAGREIPMLGGGSGATKVSGGQLSSSLRPSTMVPPPPRASD